MFQRNVQFEPVCVEPARDLDSVCDSGRFRTVLLAVAIGLMATAGCGSKSGSSSKVPDTYDGMSATQLLQSVFAKYRKANSYRDSGQVRLAFNVGKKQQVETAPLNVWFDREALYVEAYDVRLQSDPVAFMAWIKDPTTADFDSQVVRTPPLPNAPTLHGLLSDTVLSDKISAGLAGPPPQLEWLFAMEPMKRLFAEEHTIEFSEPRSIRDVQCQVVRVQANDEEYRFWIDQDERVIRRVNLPPVLAPPEYLAFDHESGVESMRLTLELDGATFAPPKDPPKIDAMPRTPRFVGRFIALPPIEPPSELGSKPPAFRIRDQTDQVSLPDREVTVLFAATEIDTNSNALFTTFSLVQWGAMISPDLQQRVRLGVVVDEGSFRQLPHDFPLPLFLDNERVVRNSLRLGPGDLVIQDRSGRIVWFQRGFTADGLARLGLIVGDVLDGIDVPARLRQQWRSDQRTYESVLAAEVARATQP